MYARPYLSWASYRRSNPRPHYRCPTARRALRVRVGRRIGDQPIDTFRSSSSASADGPGYYRKEGRWIYYSLTDQKSALIELIFSHLKLDADADPRLGRDSKRIERRMAIRENGRCVLGFTELEKHQVTLK